MANKQTAELTQVLENKPAFTAILMRKVEQYFQNPEHRKAFEVWYLKRYGKPYTW